MDPLIKTEFVEHLTYTLFRRKGLMAVVFGVCMGLFVFAGYLMTPTWEGQTFLSIQQNHAVDRAPFADVARPVGGSPAASYSEDLATLLGSKGMAYTMVKAFHLDDRRRQKVEAPNTFHDKAKMAIVNIMTSPLKLMQALGLMSTKEHDWVDEAADDFRSGLFAWVDAKSVEDSQIVDLTVHGETPELAMQIANAMALEAARMFAEGSILANQNSFKAYGRQIAEATSNLTVATLAQAAFEKENGGISSQTRDVLTAQVNQLRAEETSLDAEISVLSGELQTLLVGTNRNQSIYLSSASVNRSQVVQNLLSLLHAKEVELAGLRTELTAQHPDVLERDAQVRRLRVELVDEVRNIVAGLRMDQANTRQQLERVRAELATFSTQEQELDQLKLNVDSRRTILGSLKSRSDELEVLAKSGIAEMEVKVLDPAVVSPLASSDFPSWAIVIIVALIFASGAALALAVFVEYWRDPIIRAAQLERQGIAVLAVVPRLKKV